jgi:hypothetical protein
VAARAWRGAGEVAKVDTIQGPSDGCPRVALALGQGSAHTGSRPATPVILAHPSKPHIAVIGRAGALTTARERIGHAWVLGSPLPGFGPARRVLQWLLPPTPRLTGRDIRYLEFSAPVPFLPETNRLLFRSRHFGGLNSHRRRPRSRGTVCQEEITERDNDERADDDAK